MDYEIVEVVNKRQFKQFLNLPLEINQKDSRFVMPLHIHTKMMMGKLGTKEKHFYLALKDGKPVARIGCKTHEHGPKKTLHFGFFECVEGHGEAADLLIKKVRSLHPDLSLMGPFHFRLEDPYVGVLVDGFENDPYFLMPYNPPYYDSLLKGAGLETAMDLFTYDARADKGLPKTLADNATEARAKGFSMRSLNPKKLREEAKIIQGIFNDALAKNWGHEELLDEQVNEMVMLFKAFIDPRVVFLVEKAEQVVACLITIPNYNPLIKSGRGRLTPKVLWDFFSNKRKLKNLRGYALGVLREYHGQKLASLIIDHAWTECVKAGYGEAEISWVHASNGPMNELSKHLGGQQNKVFRIYQAPKLNQ